MLVVMLFGCLWAVNIAFRHQLFVKNTRYQNFDFDMTRLSATAAQTMTIPTDKLTTVKEQPPRTNGSAVISVETLEKMGLNVTDDVRARAIVPYHITSVTDIFCNRELNMQTITAIGFDMDYTLAQYKKEFDLLAYNGAKEKLLSFLHYPDEVNSLQYEDNICRRGCIIDRKRGNILKLDQHLYPRAVAHGLTLMDTEQRKEAYRASFQEAETFNTPDFINIDTPFSLVDACLFAQLVDLRDRMSEDPNAATANFWAGKSYGNLWSDMRKCVDRCHKDGVIKLKVAEDPQKYIIQDKKRNPFHHSLFLACDIDIYYTCSI